MHIADVISRGIYHSMLKTVGSKNISDFNIALNNMSENINAGNN
jgi:hypothetical protein